jgi:histone H3/H4
VKNMSEIPKAPIARIIKESGAERVSEDAKAALAEYLEEVARDVAKEANNVAKIAKRKTVKADDIKLAIKNL